MIYNLTSKFYGQFLNQETKSWHTTVRILEKHRSHILKLQYGKKLNRVRGKTVFESDRDKMQLVEELTTKAQLPLGQATKLINALIDDCRNLVL